MELARIPVPGAGGGTIPARPVRDGYGPDVRLCFLRGTGSEADNIEGLASELVGHGLRPLVFDQSGLPAIAGCITVGLPAASRGWQLCRQWPCGKCSRWSWRRRTAWCLMSARPCGRTKVTSGEAALMTGRVCVIGNHQFLGPGDGTAAGLAGGRHRRTFLDPPPISAPAGRRPTPPLVLRSLGCESGLISALGSDPLGDILRAGFTGELDRIARLPGQTGLSVGVLHPGAERSFLSVNGHLWRNGSGNDPERARGLAAGRRSRACPREPSRCRVCCPTRLPSSITSGLPAQRLRSIPDGPAMAGRPRFRRQVEGGGGGGLGRTC